MSPPRDLSSSTSAQPHADKNKATELVSLAETTSIKGQHQDRGNRLFQISSLDVVVVTILTIVSAATRLYRLDKPPAVVFDELHFQKFSDRMLSGTWFFDIHPPLGKLILAYGGYLLGYRPDPTFVIEKIGNIYPPNVKYVALRIISATFSILTVPLTYMISRLMKTSVVSSIFSTICVIFDFLGLIEGRLILMESQLLFFCQTSLLLALLLWRSCEFKERFRRRHYFLLICTGLSCGFAISIKHTALATPGLIAVISFFGLHFLEHSYPLSFKECFIAGISGLSVYVTSFYVMFKLLWLTGGKYDNFMPLHFRRTLIGCKDYVKNSKRVSFMRLFLYLNQRMIASNAGIKKRHNWESFWYQWIINWRGVLYYTLRETEEQRQADGSSGTIDVKSKIYLFGNPIIIYCVLFSVFGFVLLNMICVRYRDSKLIRYFETNRTLWKWNLTNGIFLLWGWLCNLLPYILVDRAAFIYHYIPGLFYGQLLCGVVLDLLPFKTRVACVCILSCCIIAGFVYWSPWIYGLPLTDAQHTRRKWLPRWT